MNFEWNCATESRCAKNMNPIENEVPVWQPIMVISIPKSEEISSACIIVVVRMLAVVPVIRLSYKKRLLTPPNVVGLRRILPRFQERGGIKGKYRMCSEEVA